MGTMIMDDDGLLSENEVIKLRVRPNAFLYAIEAARLPLLIALAMGLLSIPLTTLRGVRLPIEGFVLLFVVVYCMMGSIFFALVTLKALGMVFVITNKTVIAYFSMRAMTSSRLSIPIDSITDIEIRRYGARHGSAYLNARPTYGPSPPPASVKITPGWLAIWLSVPFTKKPPLTGFYGFRDPETFARLIVELQTAARLVQPESQKTPNG